MAAKKEVDRVVQVSVTEVTFSSGRHQRQEFIRLEVDGASVQIPVSAEIKAYWNEQFVRPNPTPLQQRRFATFMNVMRAAYKKGREDSNGKN